ncbi:hypothetical protein SPRG_22125 [Saprolegnia parasitica CBS 223.65]|uniref:WW domain-containing protein n=1 Tax=Saprolegnia parasitica (strain CBS 223.65) TaxID=695850 RepID=A0A067CXG6_SAPPC|nr:hypothetical protein SPRG_22125 [Saprolegnia parasitica CBS 223.65]KDO31507.1 hypothetical protein SPRG_22125 [Saprolegnia parasitica CBS 223.65]|eukprot:XP_012198116.1 hypothetical protein SPRG_22125 [Saprolegnia parasitica CBS 223.65]
MPDLTNAFLETKVYAASRLEFAASGINEARVLSNVIQSRVVTTLEALAIPNAGIYCTLDDTLYQDQDEGRWETQVREELAWKRATDPNAAAKKQLAPGAFPNPAKMDNWSVEPDRYMRQRRFLHRIARLGPDAAIGFCDISRGLKGDPVDDEEDETELEPEKENKLRLRAIESEQMKTLVVTQLHKEVWAMDKKQLKQVVMAMTKNVDSILLQQRRKHIKQRIAKLQDRQHGSSNGLRSESSSNDSAPHDCLQQRAHMNSTELLVGDMDRARFNATELLARPDVDARRLNHTELHGSSSMSSEGKRRSNSVEGRGVSSHSSVSSSSSSSNGMRLHDPADYASLTLDRLEHELLVVKVAMQAPQLDGLTKDRYRRQLSELNARIARAEADAKRDSSVQRSELAELKQHLKAVGTRLEETTHEKTFRALLQKRADLKGKIARLEQQLVPEMPPAPAPLHPNASPAEITMYISGHKRELREQQPLHGPAKELKQAILTAQEALQRTSAVTTASTDVPTSRAPSEAMPETMDAPAVEKHIAGLKRELIVSAVAQPTASTAQKPELLRRRSIVKDHLAAAQDDLAQITSPDVEKARHEIAVVQQYIASLQDDLAAVLAKINSKAPADLAKSSLYMMRRNDLKNNLSFAQDQLVELTQNLRAALAKARPIPSRSSTASSDKRDSSKAEILDEPIPLSSEDHLFRKRKVVWCSIEASGCLCWYKSQRDLKHVRGYVDLAKTSARNVFVNYARGNTFDLHVVSPGLLANTEEVRAINDTIKVLETATPMGADTFGRNSVVF